MKHRRQSDGPNTASSVARATPNIIGAVLAACGSSKTGTGHALKETSYLLAEPTNAHRLERSEHRTER